MNQPPKTYTEAEMDAALRTATYEELIAGLYAGKLHEVSKAGVELGITPTQLFELLGAIDFYYAQITDVPEGVPH
jgi:hypothetical protein